MSGLTGGNELLCELSVSVIEKVYEYQVTWLGYIILTDIILKPWGCHGILKVDLDKNKKNKYTIWSLDALLTIVFHPKFNFLIWLIFFLVKLRCDGRGSAHLCTAAFDLQPLFSGNDSGCIGNSFGWWLFLFCFVLSFLTLQHERDQCLQSSVSP